MITSLKYKACMNIFIPYLHGSIVSTNFYPLFLLYIFHKIFDNYQLRHKRVIIQKIYNYHITERTTQCTLKKKKKKLTAATTTIELSQNRENNTVYMKNTYDSDKDNITITKQKEQHSVLKKHSRQRQNP